MNNEAYSSQTIEAKTVFLGNTQVGKTCLVNRGIDGIFSDHTKETIGACYSEKIFCFNSQTFKLQLWDTAGQERFKTLVPLYFRNAVIAAIVFSVDSKSSFRSVDEWLKTLHDSKNDIPLVVLVATKVDLVDERKVTREEAETKAEKLGFTAYFETSSLSGEGVNDFFNYLGKQAYHHCQAKVVKAVTVNRAMEPNDRRQGDCC